MSSTPLIYPKAPTLRALSHWVIVFGHRLTCSDKEDHQPFYGSTKGGLILQKVRLLSQVTMTMHFNHNLSVRHRNIIESRQVKLEMVTS